MTLLPVFASKRNRYWTAAVIDLLLIIMILMNGAGSANRIFSPLILPGNSLQPITVNKSQNEVFGFVPYWNMDKLQNIDFNVLTTLAYFGVAVNPDGSLDKDSPGYDTFKSSQGTDLFKKAHRSGTRVVLTVTQMDNGNIEALMDGPDAQKRAVDEIVRAVKMRGIDGVNVDMEYQGDPGQAYRDKFTAFVKSLSDRMHTEVPGSQVSVSVYASAVKDPKIYNIAAVSKVVDTVFMMAYDFAVAGSDNAIPTAPLYGHTKGKYWYDISTAVADFTAFMPPNKLILGVPYYGYNYLVYEPTVKAETRPYYSWRGQPYPETYSALNTKLSSNIDGVADQVVRGWDNDGQVGYVAYHVADTDTWRMVFMEDAKSLGLKYDFARAKGLLGVGIWALGNDDGRKELWTVLEDKFGQKQLANVTGKQVNDYSE